MIYLRIDGRIGNQLFMYAFARSVSERLKDSEIVIDDTEVLKRGYLNSLPNYRLENVKYVHSHRMLYSPSLLKQNIIFTLYRIVRKQKSFNKRFELEKKWQSFFNKNGAILCENGYLEYDVTGRKNVFIDGYYQSEKYFSNIREEIRKIYSLAGKEFYERYPGIEQIRNRNSVCVSIKVQHNVGSSIYNICNDGYWLKAIDYICENVDNPLFFICSDNIEYVRNNLIDCNRYDAVYQDSSFPVHESLAVMGLCKHFVVGNTTFGWWAQYLSSNSDKIVVAPSKWMKIDMPIDIYQNNWYLVEVE